MTLVCVKLTKLAQLESWSHRWNVFKIDKHLYVSFRPKKMWKWNVLKSNPQLGWPLGSELQWVCSSYGWYHFQVGHAPLWGLQTEDNASCLYPFSGCPSEAAELGRELLNSLLSNENHCRTKNITHSQGSERVPADTGTMGETTTRTSSHFPPLNYCSWQHVELQLWGKLFSFWEFKES